MRFSSIHDRVASAQFMYDFRKLMKFIKCFKGRTLPVGPTGLWLTVTDEEPEGVAQVTD